MNIPTTKTEAIALFGGSTRLAEAVGTSKQSIGNWKEELTAQAKMRIELALLKKQAEEQA